MTRHIGEQVVAGVVLSERLGDTVYGALYRAQVGGHRHLRGLLVAGDIAANDAFRRAVLDPAAIDRVTQLSHPNIVPVLRVEADGRSIVVVTRSRGNRVSLHDLLKRSGGKLAIPIAATIARSVIEALAAAHDGGVIHGAVHPQSVLINGDGTVQLDDVVLAHGIAAASAHGTALSPWRVLAGYAAADVVAGTPPSLADDVYAVGAILFAMLVGRPPPGGLHATPGIERLIRRAVDTDPQRRYESAAELVDGLCEAMDDDRWAFATPSELASYAGLSSVDSNIEEATEDLLATLEPAAANDSAAMARQPAARSASEAALDAVLGEVEDPADSAPHRYPEDPLPVREPPPTPALRAVPVAPAIPVAPPISPVAPLSPAPAAPVVAPAPVMSATALPPPVVAATSVPALTPVAPVASVRSVAYVSDDAFESAPRLTSRVPGVLGLIAIGLVGYFVYHQYTAQQTLDAASAARADERKREAAEAQRLAVEDLPDPGSIRVTSNPPQAGVWLKIGRTPVTSLPLSSAMMHELRFEGIDGYDPIDTQVVAANWSGTAPRRSAAITVALPRAKLDPRTGKAVSAVLPAMPPKPPASADTGFSPGRGSIQITSTPPGAEVWMYIGMTNGVELSGIQSGLPYELRLLADGYLPGFVSVTADEWRSGGDATVPINRARKRTTLEKSIDLVPQPRQTSSTSGKHRGAGGR